MSKGVPSLSGVPEPVSRDSDSPRRIYDVTDGLEDDEALVVVEAEATDPDSEPEPAPELDPHGHEVIPCDLPAIPAFNTFTRGKLSEIFDEESGEMPEIISRNFEHSTVIDLTKYAKPSDSES